MPNLCVPLRMTALFRSTSVLSLVCSFVIRSSNDHGARGAHTGLSAAPFKEIFNGTIPQESCARRASQRRGRGESSPQRGRQSRYGKAVQGGTLQS